MVMESRIPVRCVGNRDKKYDGKVWQERTVDIIEHRGRRVSSSAPLVISDLNTGDAVKVRQKCKNGLEKVWNGIIELDSPVAPNQNHTPTKRNMPCPVLGLQEKRKKGINM